MLSINPFRKAIEAVTPPPAHAAPFKIGETLADATARRWGIPRTRKPFVVDDLDVPHLVGRAARRAAKRRGVEIPNLGLVPFRKDAA